MAHRRMANPMKRIPLLLLCLLAGLSCFGQQPVPPAATQAQVNSGTATFPYVSPATLAGWTGGGGAPILGSATISVVSTNGTNVLSVTANVVTNWQPFVTVGATNFSGGNGSQTGGITNYGSYWAVSSFEGITYTPVIVIDAQGNFRGLAIYDTGGDSMKNGIIADAAGDEVANGNITTTSVFTDPTGTLPAADTIVVNSALQAATNATLHAATNAAAAVGLALTNWNNTLTLTNNHNVYGVTTNQVTGVYDATTTNVWIDAASTASTYFINITTNTQLTVTNWAAYPHDICVKCSMSVLGAFTLIVSTNATVQLAQLGNWIQFPTNSVASSEEIFYRAMPNGTGRITQSIYP